MCIHVKSIAKFCLAVLFIQFNYTASGQFRDATVPGTAYGVNPVTATNSGNDIMTNGGVTYSATVWDDANGVNIGFGWKVGNVIGYTPVGAGSQVQDPDIALVNSSTGTVYALVVYFDNAQSRFMLESYQWNTNQQQFTALLPIVLTTGTYHRSINIGANDNGEFAIVWDEPGDVVRLAIGRAQTSIPVIVPIGGAQYADLLPGSQPDVCVFRSAASGYRQVNVVYKHPGNYLEVDFYRWNDLVAGIINANPFYRSALPDLAYNNPRIACPPSLATSGNDFTIVTEDTDGNSTWFIKVINSNQCCTPQFNSYVYNNGTTGNSPYNTTDVANTRPVVSYDNAYNMVWVGWEIDNSFGLLTAPGAAFGRFPIAITGNKRGRLEPLSRYLYVPTGVSFGVNSFGLSISGNRSNTALFSYQDGNNNEMYFKNYQHILNTPQLRFSESQSVNQWLDQLESSSQVLIELYDLSGRLSFSKTSSKEWISLDHISSEANHLKGNYLIRMATTDGSESVSGMIFLTR